MILGQPGLAVDSGNAFDAAAVGLMKIHTEYKAFERQLDQIAPIYPETPGLFDNPKDWEEPE